MTRLRNTCYICEVTYVIGHLSNNFDWEIKIKILFLKVKPRFHTKVINCSKQALKNRVTSFCSPSTFSLRKYFLFRQCANLHVSLRYETAKMNLMFDIKNGKTFYVHYGPFWYTNKSEWEREKRGQLENQEVQSIVKD